MYRVAVIGLGRFGMTLARHLGVNGVQVLAIDRSESLVSEVMDYVDVAVRLDSTDEAALRGLDVTAVDVCVVAVGENFEGALLTVVLLKKLGAKHIICRAQTAFHAEIFKQIGADAVIQPEVEAGQQLAHKLANPHIEDFLRLAEGYTLIELHAPRAFHDKTLQSLGLRHRYDVNLVAIKRSTATPGGNGQETVKEMVSVPKPTDVIRPNDVLVLAGSDHALAKLPKE